MSRPTLAGPGRRGLHPGAWWLWAACLAGAASRTTNPILLLLLGAVVLYVAAARRTDAPWSRSIVVFLRLGLVVILIRVVLVIVFGNRLPGHVLFTLPHVPLPSWAAGVSIGGPVTAEAVLAAVVQGLRLAVVLVCFGAANSLASPYRLLRCLPAVLYEAGVAITVALSFAPELVMAITDVRAARRLRGRPVRGLAGLRGTAVPCSSVRSTARCSWRRRWTPGATAGGCRWPAACAARRPGRPPAACSSWWPGSTGYWWRARCPVAASRSWPSVPCWWGPGWPPAGVGPTGHGYRPDPWGLPEWLVAGSGVVALDALVVAGVLGVSGLEYVLSPLRPPTLPVVAAVGILVGLVPAWAAPVERTAPATRVTPTARPADGAEPGGNGPVVAPTVVRGRTVA